MINRSQDPLTVMFSLMDRLPQVISETAEVLAANRRTLVGKRRKRGKILSSKKILEFLEIHDSARGFFSCLWFSGMSALGFLWPQRPLASSDHSVFDARCLVEHNDSLDIG